MKKLIILFLSIFCVTTSFSQEEQSKVKEAVTETERIVDKYGSKLAESFSEFMEGAKPMAQEGFKVVVRLQIAKGICKLLFIPLSIFCVWLFYRNLTYITLVEEKDVDPLDTAYGVLFISGIVGIISIIASVLNISLAIQMILAPEWFAIKEISSLFS